MGLLRLAGFRAVRVTSFWSPGAPSRPRTRRWCSRTSALAAAAARRPRLRLRLPRRLAHDAADARRARAVRAYAAAIARAHPTFRDVIVGNEPNLNRFWLPQFDADGSDAAAPAYLRLLADDLRRAEGGVAGRPRLRRRARAARRRPAGHRPGHELPHELHPRPRRRRTARAAARCPVMDGFAFHPYPLNSSVPVDALPSDPDHHRADRPGQLVRLLGEAFDGTAQLGIEAADPLRRVRRRVGDPGGQARALRRRRARDDAPGRRGDAGGRLPARDPARVLPAERRRHAPLPHARRARPAGLAVRARLRGRLAEDLARARPAGDGAGGRGLTSAPARSWRRCLTAFTTAQRTISLRCERACTYRARLLRLPRRTTVATTTGRAARGRGAGRSGSSRPESTPGWYQLVRLARRRGAARPARRARQHAVRGALPPRRRAPCRLRRRRPDRPRASGWSRRRLGPARRARPSSSCRTPASARSGSRASGSPGCQRRPRTSSPPSAAWSSGAGDTRIFLAVYHPGSGTTPLTPEARQQFADYVAAICATRRRSAT